MTSSRTAAAMAMARAFTVVSITGSSSSSSAESPASLIAGTVVERPDQLPMDAAKTAVGHQHDHIAVLVFTDDGCDDVVVVRNVPRPCATCARSEGSEEHTSELQSQSISYAVFCLKKKTN